MPRKKGHGIPPTKRIKAEQNVAAKTTQKSSKVAEKDGGSNSVPSKNEMGKAGVETQVVTKSVNGGGGNGGGGSSSSDAEGGSSNGENNYLHKKFKKIAAAASADSNTALPITNGVDCASSNRPNDNEVQDESKVISGGRYMCPYCKLACAKPSVLEKHIRAHTNERPYPCVPCGFAFKTKSNLYKHCRSRAHAVKVGDAETDEPGKCHDLSGSDDDIGDAQARLTVTSTAMPPSTLQNISQADLQKKIDDRISKTIYKPKFHTTSLYVENTSQSPVSDLSVTSTAKESWSSDTATPTNTLSLNMPPVDRAALSENSVSSPFTSCSSPSPEFLHRHISKLISDNQAIVETMDPIWPKKFLHRSNSKEASHSPSSHFPSVVSDNVLSFKKTESSEVIPPFSNYSLLPEKRSENELNSHSKLALALLRPADNLEHNYRSPSPLMQDVCSDQQPLNLTTNSGKIGQTGNNSRKRSYSEGFPYGLKESELPPQSSIKLIKSATGFTRAVPAELNISLDSKTLHDKIMKHTMMSGSVMKDSTFKSNIPIGPHGMIVTDGISSRKSPLNYTTSNKSQSPEIRSICETCNASCRNAQELRIHQMYFCKWDESIGHDKPLNDPALTKTPTKGEGPVMIAPPFPSPGPLLGKTPLVDSYARSVSEHKIDKKSPFKKVKHDMDVKGESKPLSLLTTLRSLEELSRSPMKNNLHMFGGEVKILDDTSGEAKTLRIEPSNRGSQGSSEVTLDISSASGYKDKLNNNETGIAEEKSPQIVVNMAKTGFHSGGVVQVPHKIANSQEAIHQRSLKSGTKDSSSSQVSTSNISNSKYPSSNKLIIPIIPNIVTPTLAVAGVASPVALPLAPFTPMLADKAIINPLTSITGYNPLTLPPAPLLCAASSDVAALSPIPAPYTGGIVTILHGGKAIPYVPGMPGPHTLLQTSPSPTTELPTNNKVIQHSKKDSISEPPPSDLKLQRSHSVPTSSDARKVPIPSIKLDSAESNNKALPDAKQSTAVKILNNRRNTISPISSSGSPVAEKPPPPPQPPQEEDAGSATNAATERRFLRPTSLPLKPGTFTPKKVGTPNVLPLVSPETPRPRKSYGQLYLNGHAYTYLGLKCSTRVFFCTLNKPQPIYVPLTPEHSNISMYSNWKIRSDADPNPFGLEPGQAMAHYDSRHRPTSYTVALSNKFEAVTHSSQWKYRPLTEKPLQIEPANKLDSPEEKNESLKENTPKRIKIFDGGFESNEDYIYVRGRGRGRYVCEICGIRCKKPSMLKKHIRIHTDVRPFTCKHCNFSFKTKGNLTKHMKSKAHFKKCSELGVEPVPTWVDDSHIDAELLARQQAMRADRGLDPNLTDDDEDDDEEDEDDDDEDVDVDVDGDDDDYEDDCNSRLEQDAVRSLLSLSEGPPSTSLQSSVVRAGLVATHGRPHTYPYSHPVPPAAPPASPHGTHEPQTPTLSAISAQREREKVSQNTGLARVHPDEPPAQVERSEAGVGVTSRYYFPSTRNSNSSLPQDKTKTSPDAPTSESASNNETEPHKISSTSFPMDLSYKSSDETRARTCEAALLLASLCSTVDALPTTPTPVADVSEDSQLLQAYLTERAVKQQHIKQHQYHRPPQGGSMLFTSTASIQTPTDKPLNPADVIPQPSSEKSKFLSSTKSPNFHVESLIRPTPPPPPPPPPVSEPNDEEESDKESTSSVVARKADTKEKEMVDASDEARKSPPLDAPPSKRPKAEFIPPSNGPPPNYVSVLEDGRSMCLICNKLFTKPSQLWLHVNIHYFERPFRCESCAVSFRTKGHLQKHQRSVTHMNKMSMNSTFGTATTSNPRPFKCDDCKIAFRIHGHLAKHLRSKMHIMKLECLGKLPFGTYAEMERSGINMNDIDTTDCDNSLESLQLLAQKLIEKDPSKLGQWDPLIQRSMSTGETSSEDEDAPAAVLAKTILAGVPRPSGHHDASYKGPSPKSTDSNSTTVISSSSDALSHTPKTDSVKTVIQRGSQLILREPNNREESSAASGPSPFPVHSFGNSILLRAPSSNSVLGPTTGTGSYSQQLGKLTTKLLMNSSQVSERTRDSTVVSAIKSKVETNSEKNCS